MMLTKAKTKTSTTKKKWWKRWEWLASFGLDILAFSPEILLAIEQTGLVGEQTFVGQLAKLALPISIILKAIGLRKNVKNNDDKLPSGLRKLEEGYARKVGQMRKKRNE